MDYKRLMTAMILLMATAFPLTLVSFNASDSVNMYSDGGFTMQVTNTTNESIEGLTVYAYILDNGVPIKQLCNYEDAQNCFLWKTDASGSVNGLFHADNTLDMARNYTLKVTIGDVTQTKDFFVDQPRSVGNLSFNLMDWIKNNWAFGVILVVVISIVLVILMWFWKTFM